ncbi:MAG: carboxymuconolactone decarboxylase family protein [Polyangiaceae bacterium]
MSMLDWNAYRKQLASTIGEIAKAAPDLVKGYRTLVASRATTGALDAKTRELVALAVAVTVRCDGCIATHVELARRTTGRHADRSPTRSASRSWSTRAPRSCTLARTIDAFTRVRRQEPPRRPDRTPPGRATRAISARRYITRAAYTSHAGRSVFDPDLGGARRPPRGG